MRARIKRQGAILLLAVFTVMSLTACGSSSKFDDSKIVGSWRLSGVETKTEDSDEYTDWSLDDFVSQYGDFQMDMTFKEDGTCSFSYIYNGNAVEDETTWRTGDYHNQYGFVELYIMAGDNEIFSSYSEEIGEYPEEIRIYMGAIDDMEVYALLSRE